MPMTNAGSINGSGHRPGGGEMDLVASHQRSLLAAMMRTQGPILELGVGWYSTTLIHEVAQAQKRLALTLDNNAHWLAQFKALESDLHYLELVEWWGDVLKHTDRISRHWGVCFVDNGQPAEREYLARSLRTMVDVFVFHDTEEGHAYGYDRLLGLKPARQRGDHSEFFRYIWTDSCQQAWTTIASDTIDVRHWVKALPPVKPDAEVT